MSRRLALFNESPAEINSVGAAFSCVQVCVCVCEVEVSAECNCFWKQSLFAHVMAQASNIIKERVLSN